MNDKQIAGVMKAVKDLKAKGVTAIKVELEASMGRRQVYLHQGWTCDYCDEGSTRCDYCYDGQNECHYCDGSGWEELTAAQRERLDLGLSVERTNCEHCEGSGSVACTDDDCDEGYVTCSDCDGNYHTEANETQVNWGDISVCHRWLLERIAEKTNTELTLRDDLSQYDNDAYDPFSWIKFSRFYNDGSVDSELTFTIPIDNPDNVLHLPKVLEAFKEMSEEIGNGFQVQGAGMHIATLFTSDCSYPSQDEPLPTDQLRNFRRSVTQLLPALYFLATTKEISRPLRYRKPVVSIDRDKYSAVVYRLGSFEFRVFDTCYDTPFTVLDDIVVIANCMKYLSSKYISPGVEKLATAINFGNDYSDKLERFYGSPTHLDVLSAGLAKIKPSYYTIKELKQQRKFACTKISLSNFKKEAERKARIAYEEYEERFKWQERTEEMRYKAALMSEQIDRLPSSELPSITNEQLEELVKPQLQTYLTRLRNGRSKMNDYIAIKVRDYERQTQGQHQLIFE